ncbi:hypothetical protein T07_11064 [Trichinella nelsoni]|uniref:Uncharacterized protein n=1 Tax=Trichinella nelsoni TaxID=6336 RepID=A0A0V0RIM6_9BILA|nr:hypothetical protein T07_11064 [Trichinella nelsoni]
MLCLWYNYTEHQTVSAPFNNELLYGWQKLKHDYLLENHLCTNTPAKMARTMGTESNVTTGANFIELAFFHCIF